MYERGRQLGGELIKLFFLEKPNQETYFGISVTRRIKKAHERNKLKRRTKEILRGLNQQFVFSGNVVINIHSQTLFATFKELENNIVNLLKDAKIVKNNT